MLPAGVGNIILACVGNCPELLVECRKVSCTAVLDYCARPSSAGKFPAQQ